MAPECPPPKLPLWADFSFENPFGPSLMSVPKSEKASRESHVRNFSARSGAGNGCANFMGAWHFVVLSAGKPPCP